MTADEMRRAGTLALVIRWAHAREEAVAASGSAARRAEDRVEGEAWRELSRRGVDMHMLERAIDADGGRS